MSENQPDELISYLQRLLATTREGRIRWSRANPSTFVFDKWEQVGVKGARLSIQKVMRTRTEVKDGKVRRYEYSNYVFTASEVPSNRIQVTVNTEQVTNAQGVLTELFNQISSVHEKEGMEFLKRFIDETPTG